MKRYIKCSESKYSNKIKYTDGGIRGSGPIYWKTSRGDRIVELLNQFSEILDKNQSIDSWEIIASGREVNVMIETIDGVDHPYWSFMYSSLKSDNVINLRWLENGLKRMV